MLPIRKVSDNKASLTSYYGKLFINRTEKAKFNLDRWVLNQVELKMLEGHFSDVIYGKFEYPHLNLPRELIVLASRYRSLTIKENGIKLTLDRLFAIREPGAPIQVGVTKDDKIIKYYRDTHKVIVDGQEVDFDEFLGFNVERPTPYCEINVLGEKFPVGFLLARKYGISELCRLLEVKPVKLERGQRIQLSPDQYVLKFQDEVWIFNRKDQIAMMVFAGMNHYASHLKEYPAAAFEEKDIYGSILMSEGLSVRYENEFDLMDQMFVDDITEQVLVKMNEPTEFPLLLVRCCELLLKGETPEEINMDDMMIKGYERIAGAVYRQLVIAMRGHKMKRITSKRRFDINPNDVWLAIQKDPAMEIVDEINPMKNIKEKTNVTFGGVGGRSKRSMTGRHRHYDESDLGVISEASVDNSDVGVTTFLSSNPNLGNLYGTKGETKELTPANIFSSVALASPCSDVENSPRILFSSIQAEHKIPMAGLMPMPLRTGYESVVSNLVDKRFAFVARDDGKIIDKDENTVTVQYKDGTQEVCEYGVRFAKSKGDYYKHILVCDYDVGQVFKKDWVLVFNQMFFLRDILNPGKVVHSAHVLAPTAIVDFLETFEDSVAISDTLSDAMTTKAINVKQVTIEAKAYVSNMLKIGTHVENDDILCVIEDQVIVDTHVFDDQSSDTLRRLGSSTPKAGYEGTIEKIEVYYCCEKEEMSESVRKLVAPFDAMTAKLSKKLNDGRASSNQLTEATQIGGEKVQKGQVLFRFFISHDDGMSQGDKSVFFNQMKNTVSRRLVGKSETKSGRPVDAWFSYQSIQNRVVLSPELIGTTNTLLRVATQRALAAYDS